MTGRSLMPVLTSKQAGQVSSDREFVLTGMEKHVYSYPSRAMRTKDFLYILNFQPQQWPSGEVVGHNPQYDFAAEPWPTEQGAFSFNIDPSPTKQLLRLHRKDPAIAPIANLSFAERPNEELYDLARDPHQLRNIASESSYAATLQKMRRQLKTELVGSGDPRMAPGSVPSSDYVVTKPPKRLALPEFYQKYVDAHGYPIISSAKVNDYALKESAFLVDMMLSQRPDVREAMVAGGSRLIVMAHDEFTTDIPEYANLSPKDYWDARARGLGGSREEAVCSCAEENVLAFQGDPYEQENILIHEFAHNMHLRGMIRVDPTFDDRLKQTYERAMAQGLWKSKYASVNHAEYFAEGVQSWFNNNRKPDHDHNHVDTRRELREYDPGLAAICEEVFGKTKLVYSKPTTRLKDHLAGYDPSQSPVFRWPERLAAAKRKIIEDVKKRGDQRQKEYKN